MSLLKNDDPSLAFVNSRTLLKSAVVLVLASIALGQLGCSRFRANVDCTLVEDAQPQARLKSSPTYTILAPSEEQQASLSFQLYADMLERGLAHQQSGLKRNAPGSPVGFNLTLHYNIVHRGAGLDVTPVYGRVGFGYGYPGYGSGHYGHVGSHVQTVDLGYAHQVFLTAWVPDTTQPAGRLVLWEGYCDHAGKERSLKETMPYLLSALVPHFGQATDKMVTVRLDDDDDLVVAMSERFPIPADVADVHEEVQEEDR